MDSEYEKNEKFRELCYIGDLGLIKQHYVQHRPDLNSKNKVNLRTCLHWACEKNDLELVKFLLENGADPESINKDGKRPVFFAKSREIRNLLGDEAKDSDLIANHDTEKNFVPNFVKNPSFHYFDKDFYQTSSLYSQTNKIEAAAAEPHSILISKEKAHKLEQNSEIITVKIRAHGDEDFIEIDIDKWCTTFEKFKAICRKELEHVDSSQIVHRVRKLPNVLIRNDNDIKRLKNDQEIEFVFV